MQHKQVKIKCTLYLILIISFIVISSCSERVYTGYSGRSKKDIPKCIAKKYSVSSIYIYKR